MYMGYCEEGDNCPEPKCDGVLDWEPLVGCSCHINPPCSACTDRRLICNVCDYIDERDDYKDVLATPYYGDGAAHIFTREYAPKPLDNTKIDWRSKGHTASSMIKEGVYPEGTTMTEVLDKIKGTFGGRFEHFGNGKFKYIAYTD